MAKAQNTFIKSRMNKDLDDRLLSKGEYRDAENISVSKSEGDDVGALENILGNSLVKSLRDSELGATTIGSLSDEANNRMFFIITNYTDTSIDNLSNPAPDGADCALVMYDQNSDNTQTLLQGSYLNFSTTHPVHGINLIEDLLFWTDNRNQPRKINVNSAISAPATNPNPYYTNEDQISLAKYYPCDTPKLISTKTITAASSIRQGTSISGFYGLVTVNLGTGETLPQVGDYIKLGTTTQSRNIRVIKIASASTFHIESVDNTGVPNMLTWTSQPITVLSSTMRDKNTEFLAISNYGAIPKFLNPAASGSVRELYCISKPEVGDQAIRDDMSIQTVVSAVNEMSTPGGPIYEVTFNPAPAAGAFDNYPDVVSFCKPNPDYQANWPGDADYLEDKFVRFAYRFKFDDGEYSLISPFTQPAFVPKQQGYVGVKKTNPNQGSIYLTSQEPDLGASTIVSFFENQINEVKVHIKMPHVVNTLFDKLKITEIDILYKESDALAIRILDTFSTSDAIITGNSTDTFIYNYQSRKPWKLLSEADTVRIYDKIPVRAKTQSVTGNRVVFGNFIDKHTSPETLDYAVNASSKFFSFSDDSNGCNVSYPKHSLKQNRTYQVGLVLQDKYGRSSDVIVSSIKDSVITYKNLTYGGSTLFHKYRNTIMPVPNTFEWQGDSLKILWNNIIPETIANNSGYPGIYRSGFIDVTVVGAGSNYISLVANSDLTGIIAGSFIKGTDNSGNSYSRAIISVDPNHSSGYPRIYIEGTTLNLTLNSIATVVGNANPLGWYSYKVVVKQQAQDYYNAYTPTPLLNSPTGGAALNPSGFGSMITLLSDNINKIPADLTKVSPEQTLFRTSDEILFPRVATTSAAVSLGTGLGSKVMPKQTALDYSNEGIFFTVGNLGKVTDLGINTNDPLTDDTITAPGIFNAISNPTVATLRTSGIKYGAEFNAPGLPDFSGALSNVDLGGFSGILEIKPKDSKLEIFWETSTSGLVKELNNAILQDNAILTPSSLQQVSPYSLSEGDASISKQVYKFKVLNVNGDPMVFNTNTGDNFSMVTTNGSGTTLNNWNLSFSNPAGGTVFSIEISYPGTNYYFRQNSNLNSFNHVVTINKVDGPSTYTGTFTVTGSISNISPTIYNSVGTPITSYSQTSGTSNTDIVFNARNGSQYTLVGFANLGGFGEKELQWQNPSGTNASNFTWLGGTSGTEVGINSSNPTLQKLNTNTLRLSTNTNGTYTCNISAIDANGNGNSSAVIAVSVTVSLPVEENDENN